MCSRDLLCCICIIVYKMPCRLLLFGWGNFWYNKHMSSRNFMSYWLFGSYTMCSRDLL